MKIINKNYYDANSDELKTTMYPEKANLSINL